MVNIPDGPARENYEFQRIILIVGGILMVAKFVAFLWTNSVSILTDALESIVNVIAGVIGLYALWLSAQPADHSHPYGHGKIELISASVEGTMICAAGIMIILASVQRIITPQEIGELDLGLVIIAVSAAVNFALGYTAVKKGRKNGSIALESSGKHLCTDTYDSVGIIIGLILVCIGSALGHDVRILDGIVALAFGIFIMTTGIKVVHKGFCGIMDGYDEEIIIKVTRAINHVRVPEMVDVHNLRAIRYGASVHVDAHIVVPGMLTVSEAHDLVDVLEPKVLEEIGTQVDLTLMTEPCNGGFCSSCEYKCADRKEDFTAKIPFGVPKVTELEQETGNRQRSARSEPPRIDALPEIHVIPFGEAVLFFEFGELHQSDVGPVESRRMYAGDDLGRIVLGSVQIGERFRETAEIPVVVEPFRR